MATCSSLMFAPLCFQSENILEQPKGDRAPEERTLGAGSFQIRALDMLEQRFSKINESPSFLQSLQLEGLASRKHNLRPQNNRQSSSYSNVERFNCWAQYRNLTRYISIRRVIVLYTWLACGLLHSRFFWD